ncbi:hypothetical protein [Aeromicrobium wangtongii]|uniref:hypothetical protein n=1 Tax=Aeromicrobium wangtongii TaxID=2969247 RepID=UPI002016FF57|nr:hypothetical protein [Aeromicrobium wangtongii]MCL3820335.1 hypothetical protein [Aeromicrobium wangtongii]
MRALLRAAAVAVASTALVAGTTTMASAAPGDTATVTTAVIQPVALSGFKNSTSTFVPGTFAYAAPGTTSTPYGLKANVNVNGRLVAAGVRINSNGFYYERAWGAGAVTLTNFTLSGYDSRPAPHRGAYTDRPVAGASNAVQIRYGVEYRSGIQVRKKGKKLTFKIKARYVDSRGKNVGIRKATIQVKKGSKWKTLKKVNLKKNGTKTFTRKDGKKRYYRLVIKTTSVYQGGQTKGLKI